MNAFPPPIFVRYLTERSEGNPFFIEEMRHKTGTDPAVAASDLLSQTRAGSDAHFSLNGKPVVAQDNYVASAIPGVDFVLQQILISEAHANGTPLTDLANLGIDPTKARRVRLSASPSDPGGIGEPKFTEFFRIGNDPPGIEVANIPTASGDVPIVFTLW